jgi:hypothetical protein
MLITDRDYQAGGERCAVPTLGEVEGKLLVSEVIATSCLHQLFAHSESAVVPAIKRRIRRLIESRCCAERLCDDDTKAAIEYGFQLLDSAAEAVGKPATHKSRPSDGCDTIRRLRAMPRHKPS